MDFSVTDRTQNISSRLAEDCHRSPKIPSPGTAYGRKISRRKFIEMCTPHALSDLLRLLGSRYTKPIIHRAPTRPTPKADYEVSAPTSPPLEKGCTDFPPDTWGNIVYNVQRSRQYESSMPKRQVPYDIPLVGRGDYLSSNVSELWRSDILS